MPYVFFYVYKIHAVFLRILDKLQTTGGLIFFSLALIPYGPYFLPLYTKTLDWGHLKRGPLIAQIFPP